jgi:dual specificity phosphatase 12
MDQVLPGLWIGDLHSAKDANTLIANNVQCILTVMRGRFSIPDVCPVLLLTLIYTSLFGLWRSQSFFRHQIPLDDVEEADVLQHLIPSITVIQAELDKGRGILVHCQAGTSACPLIYM